MRYATVFSSIASLHALLDGTALVAATMLPTPEVRMVGMREPGLPVMRRRPTVAMLAMDRAIAPLHIGAVVDYIRGNAMRFETVGCASDSEGCHALCDEKQCTVVAPVGVTHRLKVGTYFAVWFLLSVGYSVYNKRVTNVLALPWTVATATLLVGSAFVAATWLTGVRAPPPVSLGTAARRLWPLAAFHAIGHTAGTLGTAAGSVSFAQVVKAAGPVYACALSAAVMRERVSLRVWLSLVPIVGGVALATCTELAFSWAALLGAVVSDLALALRNILSKTILSPHPPPAEKTPSASPHRLPALSAADLFGLLTCLSAALSLVASLVVEGRVLRSRWALASSGGGGAAVCGQLILAGLFFYGYSEAAMIALSNVHPITHAVGNTMRRVIIMLVCIALFRTPVSPLGALGSAFAVGGSYVYAVTKHREKQRSSHAQSSHAQPAAGQQAGKPTGEEAGQQASEQASEQAGQTDADDELLERVQHTLPLQVHLRTQREAGGAPSAAAESPASEE